LRFLRTSKLSFKIDELKEVPGICIIGLSPRCVFTLAIDIFFPQDEVFFQEFLFEILAIDDAFVL
jgi:hypothetical protein